MSKIPKPPKKLSAAIMMALNDLALVKKDPSYKVNMGSWHTPYDTDLCHVCFAGSVMAKEFGSDPTEELNPFDFGSEWASVFYALNDVRVGLVASALRRFYSPGIEDSLDEFKGFSRDLCDECLSFENDPEEFKNAMCDLAAMLESLGY